MRRRGRRILWLVAFALVILIGLGAYTYFIGTRTLLEHPEAYKYRRMLVTQLPEEGTYRFFYTTNRVTENVGGQIEDRFGTGREPSLKFGRFDTRIEPTLGLGMLLNPSDWFLNEEIQLKDVQALAENSFSEQLRAQVEASPHRSLLVIVHGFREAFPSALRKTAFLSHVLDINTPVLLFDWPGNQGSSLRGYRRARQAARDSGAELAATLELIIDRVQPHRLWLMANSMGGQVVVDAFHVLYRDADFSDSPTEIENVVLTAADVDHGEFNRQFKHEIKALADNVTFFVSSNDRALLVSRILNRGQRLGESTLDPKNPSQENQVASLIELLEPGEEQLILVDVTPVNRTRNFHNFSLETPEFFDDLFQRFVTTEPPQSRELYRVETPQGSLYYVLTQAR